MRLYKFTNEGGTSRNGGSGVWNAIAVARRFADGAATREELAAAGDAAGDAQTQRLLAYLHPSEVEA